MYFNVSYYSIQIKDIYLGFDFWHVLFVFPAVRVDAC